MTWWGWIIVGIASVIVAVVAYAFIVEAWFSD